MMIEKISLSLTNKIRRRMPEVDDIRADAINYGLQLIIGEIPKIFIMLFIAYILGVFKLSLIAFFILLPYRTFSGGFHLHTHIGCIVTTCAFYSGTALISKMLILNYLTKYILVGLIAVFGIVMIKLYAPADTENVPILRKKDRKRKKLLSYISFIVGLLIALFIKNNLISNIIIFGYFIQTCMITKFAYRITNNKYGYEVYGDSSN